MGDNARGAGRAPAEKMENGEEFHMDGRFEWREEYSVGVEDIDKEHQRLFQIINKLFAFREEEKDSQWLGQEGIKYFKGHAMKHFADEESYMESIGHPELERTDYSQESMEHFLGICAGWLVGHTLTEDKAITGAEMGTWEHLLPQEELEAMKKVIVQLVFDMFRLESQAISESYAGEKFGRGVYYRLVYGARQEEKRLEVILVFEEKLLINTVGKILGIKTNKLDAMLVNAARYTARQFVGRVMEHFQADPPYELKEENLLSYEQFRKVFEREKPQVSLLFNTGGAGYFAYCVIAPHLLESGIGTPIQNTNAMDEVEKYLMKREEQEKASPKKKILVVDDSLTIRHGMKQLLEGDYEVALAESGVSAIRTITLNRPDLVLLDYEMPIVDGKQTLEMLRSEKSFEDIPVIFLTGRRDTTTMIQVMPLKPAGYLLKDSKPADLKKEIDAFFASK